MFVEAAVECFIHTFHGLLAAVAAQKVQLRIVDINIDTYDV